MKVFLSIKEKKKIVGEAYTKAKNIKAAARQHGVAPPQITLEADNVANCNMNAADWMLRTLSSIGRGM